MKYRNELEEFQKNFANIKDKRIVLYGIGRFTATIISGAGNEFHFVGLMDKDPKNHGKVLHGLPVLSLKEAEKKADAIVINTSEMYWKIIYRRIQESKITVFYRNGEKAHIEYNDVSNDSYWKLSTDTIYNRAREYEIVTFDLYDTLIMRKVTNPTDVFELIETRLCELFHIKEIMIERRKIAAEDGKEMLTLDEIYEGIQNKIGVPNAVTSQVKQKEIEVEIELCVPRKDMVQLYHRICKKKNVLLISDMYLSENTLRLILEKCGIDLPAKIWISAEQKKTKRNGDLWGKLQLENHGKKILHIGDNKYSDVEMPSRYGIDAICIRSAFELMEHTSMGKFTSHICNLEDSVFAGLLDVRLFSNAVSMKKSKGKVVLERLEDVGYTLFGGVTLAFLQWILTEMKLRRKSKVFFFARDGYWLIEDFRYLLGTLGEKLEVEYLPISRRLIAAANCDEEKGLENMLEFPYMGMFVDFIRTRFCFELPKEDLHYNELISMPAQSEMVMAWIEPYKKIILERMKEDKENYTNFLKTKKILQSAIVVDLWFNGNNQKYLSDILRQKLIGLYMAVNLSEDNPCRENNILLSCFQRDSDVLAQECNIHKCREFVESYLTAPYGMILRVKEDGTYECAPKKKNQIYWKQREKIHNGVRSFMNDYLKLTRASLNPMTVDALWGEFSKENIILSDAIKKYFFYDNVYVKEADLNMFELDK